MPSCVSNGIKILGPFAKADKMETIEIKPKAHKEKTPAVEGEGPACLTERAIPPKKNAYDLVPSQDLDFLYKKNAHLLSRLSTTGKENTRLYTRLSSLSKETSRLGDKNSLLENRFQNLKDQISLFARQHRAFNLQSQKLKQELKTAQNLRAQEDHARKSPKALQAKIRELYLFEKREGVYRKQIEQLCSLRKKDKTEKQAELTALRQVYEGRLHSLEKTKNQKDKQIQQLDSLLRKTKELNLQDSAPLKKEIQKLKAEKQEQADSLRKLYSEKQNKDKQIQQEACALKQTEKNFNDLKLKAQKGEKHGKKLQKELSHIQKKYENLKTEKQWIQKESKIIRSRQKEIRELEKIRNKLPALNRRIVACKKEKEQLKTRFHQKLNMSLKEKDSLKSQYESARSALSSGEMGWQDALFSFQTKYNSLWREWRALKQKHKDLEKEILILRESLSKQKAISAGKRKIAEDAVKKQKDREIGALADKLKSLTQQSRLRQAQWKDLKNQMEKSFSEEKAHLLNEVEKLRQDRETALLKQDEKHTEEKAHLDSAYERRKSNMEITFKNRLQHIRAEMENELITEQKRFELFKAEKSKARAMMERQITDLQTQARALRAEKACLQTALQNIKTKWREGLKENESLQSQNKNLKSLWHELGAQNETKDRQIESLQKLNRSLSRSFNSNRISRIEGGRQKPQQSLQTQAFEPKPTDRDMTEPEKQSARVILADLHFD